MYLLALILIVNIAGFASMGIDKGRAVKNEWRISERTLFMICLLGGGIGSTLGMFFFHHKTRHWYFRLGFPTIAVIEYVVIIFMVFRIGF